MVLSKHAHNFFCKHLYLKIKPSRCLYHSLKEHQVENLPSKWYEKEFPTLLKLTHLLKDLDLMDGNLVNINDNASVFDENLLSKMQEFKSIVRTYIGYSETQLSLKKELMTAEPGLEPRLLFSKASERQPMTVNSLTKVCNFLDISAQRRKEVRLSITRQVTQHQIWAGAIEETLKALKSDMDVLNQRGVGKVDNIGQQVVVTCLKFLDTATSYDAESTSWMRPAPAKVISSPTSQKWEDVLEMYNDLISCLRDEKELAFHLAKLEVMKEGLSQIKDVLIDKNIGYRETRYQESLVSKKLSKTLGHSSPCLFTLLLYYLYGSVKDIEVELCGGVNCNEGGNKFCLYMGKILILDEERMVWSGVKQLDRALGLFKLVWETSGMKESLEVQGHLWCVGAETRSLTYKGNMFFVHGIGL
ncbi:EG45-like domain containing protein-like [Heracleum sosnowskyi]|uniref:EG45-like domain containing protein-like n=1 Tax=Heracleum sosnowskyi TaxID=360622 RepID=A0AAD8IBN6_9APIA|nr:EG45-like domain containing protein-like [Heracleum sosnowskyi]